MQPKSDTHNARSVLWSSGASYRSKSNTSSCSKHTRPLAYPCQIEQPPIPSDCQHAPPMPAARSSTTLCNLGSSTCLVPQFLPETLLLARRHLALVFLVIICNSSSRLSCRAAACSRSAHIGLYCHLTGQGLHSCSLCSSCRCWRSCRGWSRCLLVVLHLLRRPV